MVVRDERKPEIVMGSLDGSRVTDVAQRLVGFRLPPGASAAR